MAEKFKPTEQNSIVPTSDQSIEIAIRKGDWETIVAVKNQLLVAPDGRAKQAIYASAIRALYKLVSTNTIQARVFHKRLKSILDLDISRVTEDGIATQLPPKRGEKEEPQAVHAHVVLAMQAEVNRDPDGWEEIFESFPTNQMVGLGRLDLESCKPIRMSQYIAYAIQKLDQPAHNANEAFTRDLADLIYLIEETLDRDDALDLEEEYPLRTLKLLKTNNPVAYEKLLDLSESTGNDSLQEFFRFDTQY